MNVFQKDIAIDMRTTSTLAFEQGKGVEVVEHEGVEGILRDTTEVVIRDPGIAVPDGAEYIATVRIGNK